jgi:tetratricopeptide (TPR) repeat protein
MVALAEGPVPRRRPPVPDIEIAATEDSGSRHLLAHDSDRVFQAAGNIYYVVGDDKRSLKGVNTLPRDTPAFTGRQRELDTLRATVARAVQAGDPIPIHAIDGMAGVGKTTLAIHAAYMLAKDFPDGQLFVDLRAFTRGQGSLQAADALAELLTAEGVHHKQIPVGLAARASLWRARMAGRKALIIIDNADGHGQVEWLLPGSPTCLVLVTSRRRLTGLIARHAAVLSSLDTLSPDEAIGLFGQIARHELGAMEQQAVPELVGLCGYLPLAIVLLAARIGPGHGWRVDELVNEIHAAHNRLDYMAAEDVAVAVAFHLSYRTLTDATARLFRRLSLHPGLDIDAYAAAALVDSNAATARRSLDALFDLHLLRQPVRGRYRMHDLVHAYAAALAADEPVEERERAIGRVLDYYEHAATAANKLVVPAHMRGDVRAPDGLPPINDLNAAQEWLRVEQANLLACASYAQHHDLPSHVIAIAAATSAQLCRAGPWDRGLELQSAAVAAAEQCGDHVARADAMLARGVLLRQTGDYVEAHRCMRDAMDAYGAADDPRGVADASYELGSLHRLADDVAGALSVLQAALAGYRRLDDRRGVAKTLSSMAAVRWLKDDFAQARHDLELALDIYGLVDDPAGLAGALFRLGVVKRLTDDYPGATTDLRQALEIFCELGDRLGQADSRHNLGVVARMTGQYALARQQLGDGMAIYIHLGDRLGHANALKQLGVVYRLSGEYSSAVASLERALAIYSDLGDRFARANVLAALGVARQLAGDLDTAAAALAEALGIYQDLGSRLGRAEVDNAIGVLLLQRGQPSEALEHHRAALRGAHDAQSVLEEANALCGIGRCLKALDEPTQGVRHLRHALDLFRRIGSPAAEQVAAELETREGGSVRT